MKLGFFTMPIHPLDRNYTQTLKEDRETIILCDKLGFYDAFVGEHLADAAETITNSMLFLATLIHSTERIKLATGTTNLSHNHPVLVATHAAMFDHLTEGRFIFGISPGTLKSDREAVGILNDDHNKIFADAIEVILAIWEREAPYKIDFPDNRFKVTTEESFDAEFGVGVMHKPYQKPHPEIVGTVVAPFSKGVIAMGERNFHPLSANFLLNKWVGSHWGNYSQGCGNIGKTPDPKEWRIARTIFVADDDKVATAYGKTDENSPYRFYYHQLYTKLKKSGRHTVFKYERDEPDEAVTLDRICDDLVISGTVNNVVDQILAFREEVGDFGELVVAGMDWVDESLTKRSLQLLAEEVMPRVNEALGSPDIIASAAE
ncbi:MAG: LLM class flavin-dependent oxidoreductase [Rhodospirillaceae bacterium]|jgi:alkanesulfonate monooxygenase SsuD/methylene tetrahydromethanopterin reductase-like flavin-dependent oxidoreductase (luciferase family)|nr:LLM class flavin-dependent oxidoreductase [Rhodospirillaceae bacterium]MBT5457009.1 LLM class flavin-dependent oxidoreductase [Rhodospirillaceae bacterium]